MASSRGTTPDYLQYKSRFLDEDSDDSSSGSSIDSRATLPEGVTLTFKQFTDDGVHFFKTKAQLAAWRAKLAAKAEADKLASYNRPKNPLLRLMHRDVDCEECERGIPAVKYCVDCDELYCQRCNELCHIMLDSKYHLLYDFPLRGAQQERFEWECAAVREREEQQRQADAAAAEEARIARERRHKEAMEKYGWDPEDDVKQEEEHQVLTFPRFHSDQRVLFRAIERSGGEAEVKGKIVPFKAGQLRRTDRGMFWYRVRYIDDSYPGDPKHERVELVREADIEDVDENERRKLLRCILIIENAEMMGAWRTWRTMVSHLQRKDLEWNRAVDIQRVYRGSVDREYVSRVRAHKRAEEERRALRRAKLARKQARAARRLERQQKARARGITTDGVHYFMNFNDLHKWWDTRKSAAIKFKQLLYKHWFQHAMQRAIDIWKLYLHKQEEARVSELDHLKRARAKQLDLERKAALRRVKSAAMIKLKALTRLTGLQLKVSKVKKVPVNVHEKFDIEGTDRGVLKRQATERALRLERRRQAEEKGEVFVDDEADELVSVAGDTDDDEGDGSMQHTGEGGGAGAGAGAGAGGSSRSLRRGRSKKFIKGTSLPYIQVDVSMWRHLGGKRTKEDFGALDNTGTMQSKEIVKQGTRAIIATKVFYGDERDDDVPWHPATHIRLPKLPYVGAAGRPDGTLRIDSITKYNTFKSAMQGPWDASHWLIKGMLCVGAYPEGQADAYSKAVTSYSSAIAQLLMQGLDTFVCLMTDDEVVRPNNVAYEDDIRKTAREVRSSLYAALAGAKVTAERSGKSAARAKTYAKAIREKLEERARKDKAKVRINAERLQKFPSKLNFITFPIPEGAIAPDMHIVHLCENLEARLRLKEKIYIFSRTGRGRAGTVAAVLMGRIYGMTSVDCMEYMARCNEAQRRQVIIPPRATPIAVPEADPETKEPVDVGPATPKLKPIELHSDARDSNDNAFFGTTFSNFGRSRKKRAEDRRKAAAKRAAAAAAESREAKINAKLDREFTAATCTPSTVVQKHQVKRLLALTDPIYDSVSTQHEEGQFSYKNMRRNHGVPVILPSITQRDEVMRREALQLANDRRSVGGVALARPHSVLNR